MKLGIIVLCFVAGTSAFAKSIAEEELIDSVEQIETETIIVENEQMLGGCLETIQRQYLPVSIPSLERLVQPAATCFPVVWNKFSPTLRKEMRGWIDDYGIVRYSVGLYEDFWTGEIVVINNLGRDIYHIKRSQEYDPYDYQRDLFNLGETEVLKDEFTRQVFHPSKISTIVELVPLVFWDSHLQIEAEIAAQEAVAMPMMMAMSVQENPKPTAHMVQGTNGVNLILSLPSDFGDHVEIFRRNDLVYDSWAVANSWVSTYRSMTVVWNDPVATNDKCFYHISNAVDTDGDGFSDLTEAWGFGGTGSNYFDNINTDGDSMLDAWELKLFGNLDQGDLDDFDGDLIPNIEELVPGEPPVMITDPSLYSSDGDSLSDAEMYAFPPTDAWNPDENKPSASILWPTNNTLVIF